jgi:hypothetical protein
MKNSMALKRHIMCFPCMWKKKTEKVCETWLCKQGGEHYLNREWHITRLHVGKSLNWHQERNVRISDYWNFVKEEQPHSRWDVNSKFLAFEQSWFNPKRSERPLKVLSTKENTRLISVLRRLRLLLCSIWTVVGKSKYGLFGLWAWRLGHSRMNRTIMVAVMEEKRFEI